MRIARAWLLVSLLPLVLGAAAARSGKPAANAVPAPVLSIDPLELQTSPDFQWQFDLQVRNSSEFGIYCDSVIGHLEDQDPGETHTPRVQEMPLNAARIAFAEISGGDSTLTVQAMPAMFETGTLRARAYFHRGDGTRMTVETPVVKVLPGPLSTDHPSRFLTVGGKKVETVIFPARPEGPAAGLLIVHDHGAHARRLLTLAQQLSLRGYTTMLVSLPGYGQSEGPADFAGPQTVDALDAAVDELKKTPGVDAGRVALWGIGRGATAVMSLAARRNDLKLVIGQSGLYDLRAAGASSETRAAILAEAGKDSAAWRSRSPLLAASNIHASVVLLHGGADREAPIDQAKAFAAALAAAGDSVSTHWLAPQGHAVSRSEMVRNTVPHLDAKLRRQP